MAGCLILAKLGWVVQSTEGLSDSGNSHSGNPRKSFAKQYPSNWYSENRDTSIQRKRNQQATFTVAFSFPQTACSRPPSPASRLFAAR